MFIDKTYTNKKKTQCLKILRSITLFTAKWTGDFLTDVSYINYNIIVCRLDKFKFISILSSQILFGGEILINLNLFFNGLQLQHSQLFETLNNEYRRLLH